MHFLYSRPVGKWTAPILVSRNLKGNSRSLWVKIDDPTPTNDTAESSRNALQNSKVKPDIVKSIRLLMNRVWVSYQYKPINGCSKEAVSW
jgi:hypothetical protein